MSLDARGLAEVATVPGDNTAKRSVEKLEIVDEHAQGMPATFAGYGMLRQTLKRPMLEGATGYR